MLNPSSHLSPAGQVVALSDTPNRLLPKAMKTIRTFLSLCFALNVGVCGPVNASQSAGSTVSDSLSKLEDKFFEHDYRGDSDQVRLNRLEKFVFGDAQTGPVQARINSLSTVASEFKAPKKTATPPATSTAAANTKVGTSGKSAGYPSFAYANYPRVVELEKHMLGNTYPNDALPDRLARLETKAFGKPSTSTDLADRVDQLDQYADRHDIYHERTATDELSALSPISIASRAAAAAENPFITGGSGPDDPKDRIAVMENMVFGHVYPNRPEEERLERLEKKLVPYEHNLAQKDLPARVNNIWNILKLANTMNSTPITKQSHDLIAANPPRQVPSQDADVSQDSSTQYQTQGQTANSHKSWLHGLGKYLDSSNNSPLPFGGMYGAPQVPGASNRVGGFWLP
jgi:hypothetical protein